MRYILTEIEEEKINKAVDLLYKNFNCKNSKWIYYFEIKDEGLSSEHDICYSDKCLKEQKKILNKLKRNKELGTDIEKGWIKEVASSNDGDHEDISRCAICDKPLNEFLTWVKYEFQYFQGDCGVDINKNDIKAIKEVITNDYFELYAIFNSMPSCDYQKNENYDKEKELFKDIVKWAEFVCRHYS